MEAAAYERFPILGQRRTQLAGTLSGGEQQMLALSPALGTNPVLLILDELSMGLAPIDRVDDVRDRGRAGGRGRCRSWWPSSSPAAVLPIAHSAAIMLHGHVVRVGTPAEIEEDLADRIPRWVRDAGRGHDGNSFKADVAPI